MTLKKVAINLFSLLGLKKVTNFLPLIIGT
jgi:hypothetical protein